MLPKIVATKTAPSINMKIEKSLEFASHDQFFPSGKDTDYEGGDESSQSDANSRMGVGVLPRGKDQLLKREEPFMEALNKLGLNLTTRRGYTLPQQVEATSLHNLEFQDQINDAKMMASSFSDRCMINRLVKIQTTTIEGFG